MKEMMRRAAVALALAGASLAASAALVSHDLDWVGAGGYSMTGSFTYDTASVGGDNLITQADLTAFTINFFDPASALLKTYTSVADAQVFAFHTDTLLIDQGPSINFVVGQISPTDYLLIRANGCTGNDMVLYQGNGGCGAPNQFLDRAGTVTATPTNGVPEPTTLALVGLALAGLALRGSRRQAA
ncbi:PEP-CTERM sorting domain-containing protein [Aquincola sp. S2]|uniref:PEP-CTERM sorting domain-containing protein n=1 Tax=Pseudaquabacterium terrae TaxID=2732868 RepID=A0ABX2EGN1_9BURK|nr:PEP-CTERM sorting domain-containing protein [Aquabacterium terrae]NRF67765.1 PEP-CTERM sorting domain-containing protein [Aquabacterium terrae]